MLDDLIEALVSDGHLEEINKLNFRKTLQLTHIHQYEKEFQKTLDIGKKQQANCFSKISKDAFVEVEAESEFKCVTGKIHLSDLYLYYV
jgi:hypothetical protein